MMNLKNVSAAEVIAKLELTPLPIEGGYFRRTYESTLRLETPGRSSRAAGTAIFYLVTPESFSAFHRVKSDEVFHFYAGDPVEMTQISTEGKLSTHLMGSNFLADQSPQVVVERGVWQGLRLIEGGAWALLGATVAPGFEYEDFEIGDRFQLLEQFPQYRESIIKLTRL